MTINWRFGSRRLIFAIFVVVLVIAAIVIWNYRDYLRSPQDLYYEARSAKPGRAVELYARLAEKAPVLKDYARLWIAETQMPDLDAMRTLQAVVDFEPQSPLAYEAHIARARYYASIEALEAADEYHAALALNDTVALRLELARYFEQEGDTKHAYEEYLVLLSKQPDAFEGMRRTGQDPLTVAQDLISATYYSDALETLHGIGNPKALPLRAQALTGLGQDDDARTAYQTWLQSNPGDVTAQMGLARTLAKLNRTKDALAIYQQIKTPDSQLAQADLLEDTDPKQHSRWISIPLIRSRGGMRLEFWKHKDVLRRRCPSTLTWRNPIAISPTTRLIGSIAWASDWGISMHNPRARRY